ncbi:MAG: TetR/AcrR family transcriptional regulator [bacterium]|nr:TetR/AcrR family transcriptional regulator [bacterium]
MSTEYPDKLAALPVETRQHLIEAAINQFLESGYRHLTLYGIAKSAGFGLKEIRVYFQDSDEVLGYVADWLNAFWEEKIGSELPSLESDLPTDQLFAESFRVALLWGQHYSRYLRFGVRLSFEMAVDHPVRLRYQHRGMEQILHYCEKAIRRGQQAGEVRQDLHPRVASYWVMLIIMRLMDASVSPFLDAGLGIQGEFSCEIANASLDVLLRGLEPPRWFIGGY